MAFDLGSARPVAAPRPAAPAKPTRVQDRRPDAVQKAQDVSTVGTQTSTARTGQTIAQSAALFPAELAKMRIEARTAQLQLDALEKKQKEGGLELKDQQALASARATLMIYGEALYRDAVNSGYDPVSIGNKFSSALSAIPVAGGALSETVRDPISSQGQIAEKQFSEGAQRTLSGAGIRADETPRIEKQYFPSAWGNLNDKTRRSLDELRLAQISGATNIAGPALSPTARAMADRLSAPPKKHKDESSSTKLPRVKNNADYAALPSGTKFIDPDGNTRTKP